MGDTAITVRDFSGGLNTATDPAQLPPSMSASLANVEIMDSRAIKRRAGYKYITTVGSAPVKAIHRYYKADGSTQWLSVCATTIHYTSLSSSNYQTAEQVEAMTGFQAYFNNTYFTAAQLTRIPFPYGPITGRAWIATAHGAASAGESVGMWPDSTVTIPVPHSSVVVLRTVPGHDLPTVSFDGGAYVTASSFNMWTAATASHTISIRGPAVGTAYIDSVTYGVFPVTGRVGNCSLAASTISFLSLEDSVYIGNELDHIVKWNGTTVSAITASGAAPHAGFMATKQGRIFAAGSTTDRTLVECTDADKPEVWSGGDAQAFHFAGKVADPITGLAVWRDTLFVMHNSRTHAVTVQGTSTDWTNKVLSDRHGCIAPKSLIATPNALMFLSADGVRGYGLIPGMASDDGSGFILVSQHITPTIRRITPGYARKACGEFYRDRYYLSVPLDGATENSHTLVYRFGDNNAPGSWTLYDYGVTCMHRTRGDDDGLYAGTVDGTIIQLETGTSDNGVPIDMFYRIPPLKGAGRTSSYAENKVWRRLHLGAQASANQTLTVTPYTDDVQGTPHDLAVTPSTDVRPIRTMLNARGRSLGLDLSSSGNDQDITISEVTVTHTAPRMR